METQEFFTLGEVSKILKLSIPTVSEMAKQNKFGPFALSGKRILIPKSFSVAEKDLPNFNRDVLNYISEFRNGANAVRF